MSLLDLLEFLRVARESIESCRINNAASMPELIEDDLAALVDGSVQQRHLARLHSR